MFQYTKEIILNKVDGRVEVVDATNPYSGVATKKLLIKRGGEYFADFILPAKIYATEGYYGKPGKLTIDFTDVKLVASPHPYQLQFRVKTPNQFYAEYASPNWQVYGKPMLIGFEVTEEMAASPSVAAEKLVELIKLAVPANNQFIKVAAEGAKVIITGTNNFMTFDKVSLEKYDPTVCDSCLGEYNPVAIEPEIEDNLEDFATGEWIVENLRFPTYPNIRYASPAEDERPINGTTYTEFSFSYQSPRPGLGGMSGVGQGMTAVTRHIYYVPAAEAATFEALLKDAGLTVEKK